MKIGIDISQIAYKGTGVARYTGTLVRSLTQYDTDHNYTFFYTSLRKHFDYKLKRIIEKNHSLETYHFPPTFMNILWNRLHRVPIESFIGDVDIFISSDWTQPPTKKAKKVTIIHDLVVYTHPETAHGETNINFKELNISPNIVKIQKKRLSWVKKECDHIVTDSESTKMDILNILKIPEEKISVVYPSVEIKKPSKNQIISVQNKYNLTKPCILSVGKFEPRKNIPRLIKAYQKAGLDDVELVIVGPEGWKSDILNSEFGIQDSIRFLGFVSDEDLYALYSSAEFFVFPSLYEGFGYPLVEAMTLGCATAVSNTSSLREIAEGYGELFDPENEDEIAQTIIKLHKNADLRKNLHQKSLKRAKDFTHKQFVNNFMRVLEKV